MKLYRFLEPGEPLASGDMFALDRAEVDFFAGDTWEDGDDPVVRFVAEVPDDADIAAALIAAEIVEAVWDAPVHGNGVRTLLDRYRAAKGGAR